MQPKMKLIAANAQLTSMMGQIAFVGCVMKILPSYPTISDIYGSAPQ